MAYAKKGVLDPLFNRLVDGPTQPLLSPEDVRQSILDDLSVMLNTRCTVRRVVYENYEQDIPLYRAPSLLGLPDFMGLSAENPQYWPRIETIIETTIRAIEPRLTNVHVKVECFNQADQELLVTISGALKQETSIHQISFPLAITQSKS